MLSKEGSVDAVVSAGNTGALMASGLLYSGRIQGIERPALATVFPTLDKKGVLVLDVGANVEPKPDHLLQYALMGNLYAQFLMNRPYPRVGLLNIGIEETKGTKIIKETHYLLTQSPLQFIGNVEARDVTLGVCDVLICDGFSGNVLLKSIEGTASSVFSLIREELTSKWSSKVLAFFLKPSFRNIKNTMDYRENGGAPLLGLQKTIVKAHGSSDHQAIKSTILQASELVKQNYIEHFQKAVEQDYIT